MNLKSLYSRSNLVATLAIVFVTGLVIWTGVTRYQRFLHYQQELMKESVIGAASEIRLQIKELRRAIRIFSKEQEPPIQKVVANPEDKDVFMALSNKMIDHFPEHLSFTIADPGGNTIIQSNPDLVCDMCQKDVVDFAKGMTLQEVYMHHLPEGDHFDLVANWITERGEKGIFKTSFKPSTISRILSASEREGHTLLLIRRDTEGLVELTGRGYDKYNTDHGELESHELNRIGHVAYVDGTRWKLIDIPNIGHYKNEKRHIVLQSILMLGLFYGVSGILLWLVIRAEKESSAAMEAARLKTEFLSTMSHEVRTPLNSVIGLAELLLDTKLTSLQSKYVKGVQKSGKALLSLTNDLLDLSKIEAGRLVIEEIAIDLVQIIEDAMDMIAPRVHSKEVELVYLIGRDVPRRLIGDPLRIHQVLMNLLSNAVKFTEEGQVVLRVDLLEETEYKSVIRLSVNDSGIGVGPEQHKRLFKSFSQGDISTARQYGGTGLGLIISKKITEILGGSIDFDSTYGQGSTFWFTLPLRKQQPGLAFLDENTEFKDLKALIVKGNDVCREIMQEQIRYYTKDVDTTRAGGDAIKILRDAAADGDPYDVVFIDVKLPNIDSIDFIRTINDDTKIQATKIVLLTTYSQRDVIESAHNAGAIAHFIKPIHDHHLRNCLSMIVSGEQYDSELELNEDINRTSEWVVERRSLSILVADDNHLNRLVAGEMLKKMGCTVEFAVNGREVISSPKLHDFDIIFLDCEMPDMDGFETVTRIREKEQSENIESHAYVVALTAHNSTGMREKCMSLGFDYYLPKPITQHSLQGTLRSCRRGNQIASLSKSKPLELVQLSNSMFDQELLHQYQDLENEHSPGFVDRVFTGFLDESPGCINNIEQAIETSDADALYKAAHTYRGVCSTVGVIELARQCLELMEMSESDEPIDARDLFDQLIQEYSRVQQAISAMKMGPGRKAS